MHLNLSYVILKRNNEENILEEIEAVEVNGDEILLDFVSDIDTFKSIVKLIRQKTDADGASLRVRLNIEDRTLTLY